MIAEPSGDRRPAKYLDNAIYGQVFLACVVSIILHWLIVYNWKPPAVEPLVAKPPQIMEVELVKPEPPEPIIKPIDPPKPKIMKPVVKPKPLEKPKPKPVAKPKAEPKPVQSKAPPKVVQKTYTEATPEVKVSKSTTYTPIPVFGNPTAKPSKSVVSTPVTKAIAKNPSSGGVNSGVQVLQRISPRYPARALSRHIEGHVTVQFTVNAAGQVENPSVTSASPSGIFEEAALANIRQWKFKPKMVNGKPVSQRAVQTINFKIN